LENQDQAPAAYTDAEEESGGEERSLLEGLSNHLGIKDAVKEDRQTALALGGQT
jgi:hypothetical protein